MFQLLKTELSDIENYREHYLKSLPEFQELFLELMIQESGCYSITIANKIIGYTIVTDENTLIEFYLVDRFIPECSRIFRTIIKELSVTHIYCKSFDSLLLNCCLLQLYNYDVLGVMYRDFQQPEVNIKMNITARVANSMDIDLLLNQGDGIEELFENSLQLGNFIDFDTVLMFYQNDQFVGCGTILRTHTKWLYHDIGIWVKSDFRKQGIATQMVTYMREYCISKEWTGTCACAFDNIASQKTLEKSGFISKYKLIDFQVAN